MTDAFHQVEVGDKLQKETGVYDEYEVVEIEETFGDRVRVIVDCPNNDNSTISVDQAKFGHDFEVAED